MRTQHGQRARGVGKLVQRPAWMVGGSGRNSHGRRNALSSYVNRRAEQNKKVKQCGLKPVNEQSACIKALGTKFWSSNPECSGGVGVTYHGSSCGKRFIW
tara:strand:+ start:1179 stop:1478 length:300 start_codon:yes stop_codon:yes gene_type:complete